MTEKRETVEDVLAEMRRTSVLDHYEIAPFLARIEAAHAREIAEVKAEIAFLKDAIAGWKATDRLAKEGYVIPCNCNEYEGSGVDVLNCPVHGGKK